MNGKKSNFSLNFLESQNSVMSGNLRSAAGASRANFQQKITRVPRITKFCDSNNLTTFYLVTFLASFSFNLLMHLMQTICPSLVLRYLFPHGHIRISHRRGLSTQIPGPLFLNFFVVFFFIFFILLILYLFPFY